MDSITIINNILKNPDPIKDFVYVFANISGIQNTELLIPNLNSIADARNIELKNMNIIIIYLGSTNTTNGIVSLNVGCNDYIIPQNMASTIKSLDIITPILSNPDSNTDRIIIYQNLMNVGDMNVGIDFKTLEVTDEINYIPWNKMNIVVAWLGSTNTIVDGKLSFSIGCVAPITTYGINKNILWLTLLFYICCVCCIIIIIMLTKSNNNNNIIYK